LDFFILKIYLLYLNTEIHLYELDSFSFILKIVYKRLYKIRNKINKRSKALDGNPQLKGVVFKTRIVTPKKPNSARRPVAKIYLSSERGVLAHIPGIGHNLRKHSSLLVRGGGARDLPGVNYTCIRGTYDLSGVLNRIYRRSIYGIERPDYLKKKLRRKYRVN